MYFFPGLLHSFCASLKKYSVRLSSICEIWYAMLLVSKLIFLIWIAYSHCISLLFLLMFHVPLIMSFLLMLNDLVQSFKSNLSLKFNLRFTFFVLILLLLGALGTSLLAYGVDFTHCWKTHAVFVPDLTKEIRTSSKVSISWVLCSVILIAANT